MFDPRYELTRLFTNARIGASDRYGSTSSSYVKLLVTEGNEEKEANDFGSTYVGIMWLKPPRTYPDNNVDIGYNKIMNETVVDCDLIIPKNDKRLYNSSGTLYGNFIAEILRRFQATVQTNSHPTDGFWVDAHVGPVLISTDPENPNIYRRVVEFICKELV